MVQRISKCKELHGTPQLSCEDLKLFSYWQGDNSYTLKYEDLMGQFEFTLNKTIKSERIIDSFPVIMGVNAFAGVLSEFITSR